MISSSGVPIEKTPLFVRLPKQQTAALERIAGRTGRSKQDLVSQLLAERLVPGALSVGRVEVAPAPDARDDNVLTLEEAAALLKVSPAALRAAVEDGDLPGRRLGQEWRFSRMALLDWLGQGERAPHRKAR
jgi:excisionase family DNA binding protein